jgi:hypothetical protein
MDDEEQHRHGEHCQQRHQGDGAEFKAGEVGRRQCQKQQRREQQVVADRFQAGPDALVDERCAPERHAKQHDQKNRQDAFKYGDHGGRRMKNALS